MAHTQSLTLEIRTGPPPIDRQAVDIGTMLGKAELAGGGDDTGSRRHVTVFARITADGIAGHFRLKNFDDRCIDQGTIGRFGDGADLVFDYLNLRIDQTIKISPRFARV